MERTSAQRERALHRERDGGRRRHRLAFGPIDERRDGLRQIRQGLSRLWQLLAPTINTATASARIPLMSRRTRQRPSVAAGEAWPFHPGRAAVPRSGCSGAHDNQRHTAVILGARNQDPRRFRGTFPRALKVSTPADQPQNQAERASQVQIPGRRRRGDWMSQGSGGSRNCSSISGTTAGAMRRADSIDRRNGLAITHLAPRTSWASSALGRWIGWSAASLSPSSQLARSRPEMGW